MKNLSGYNKIKLVVAALFCCLDDIDVHKKWNYLHK